MLRIFLPSLSLTILPSFGSALGLDEARKLSRSNDPTAIEAAFAAQQIAFNESRITPNDYTTRYAAFYTTHPEVLTPVEAWLKTYPRSPSAMSAAAPVYVHLGIVMRGVDAIRNTPATAF